MTIKAADCDVFVLLLADTAAATAGSGIGMYLADNRSGEGSQLEGKSTLITTCGKGATICWRALPVLPCSGDMVTIQSVGNSGAWGPGGQPERAPDLAGAFTGQVQSAGAAQAYGLGVQVTLGGGSLVEPALAPQIAVKGAGAPQPQAPHSAGAPANVDLIGAPAGCPNTMIVIAIDASRFRASSGASGAYLVDNRLSIGSGSEGSPRLRTLCNAGDLVGFGVISIALNDGYSVTLSAIDVSPGQIFPGGYTPKVSSAPGWRGAEGSYWSGKAINTGAQTYGLTVRLDDGVSPYTATVVTPSIRCR